MWLSGDMGFDINDDYFIVYITMSSKWTIKKSEEIRFWLYLWLPLWILASHLAYLGFSFLICEKEFHSRAVVRTKEIWMCYKTPVYVRQFCNIYENHILQIRPVRD